MKSDSSCVTPLTISVVSLPHENGEEGRNARFLNNECMILVLNSDAGRKLPESGTERWLLRVPLGGSTK